MASMSISGLASGLDTESIIQQLLAIERVPVTRMTNRKSALDQQKSAWMEFNSSLSTLRSKLTTLKLSGTYNGRNAVSADETKVTATATSAADLGTYQVGVIQTARSQVLASDSPSVMGSYSTALTDTFSDESQISSKTDLTVDTVGGRVYISTFMLTGSLTSVNVTGLSADQIRFTATDQPNTGTIDYYYSTDDGFSWNPIASGAEVELGSTATQLKIKADFSRPNDAVVTQVFDYTLESATDAAADADTELELDGSFSINGTAVTVTATDTLRDIKTAINTAGAGVTAAIIDDRLVLTSDSSGTAGEMTFTDADGILEDLGILNGGAAKNELQAARDALFTINGLEITRDSNSVDDALSGVTLNLLEATDADGNGTIGEGETVQLVISSDTDTVVEAVQAFVDQYNLVMDWVNTNFGEADGLLNGDPTMMRIQRALKEQVNGAVAGLTQYNSLSMVGITTSDSSATLGFSASGQLTLDQDALEAALADDATAVKELFYDSTASPATGVAARLSDYIDHLITSGTGIIPTRNESLDDQMDDLQDQIDLLNIRLELKEEQLNRQFTLLESALSSLQSQGNWLAGQIATLPGFTQEE